ncbi:hypothetical protein BRD00_14685 [Halobacteriales archaeon QS_8_69_26]|nr:MAG: hypothetical protein BRD00_14685 [Halobacteriales archaeon QS_8_69_26]
MNGIVTVARVVLVASGVGLLWLGAGTRTRDQPAALSFTVLMAVLGVTALFLGVVGVGLPMYMVSWLVAFTAIPLALAVFAVDYYGLEWLAATDRVLAFLTPAVVGGIGGLVVILGEPEFSAGRTAAVGALAALPSPAMDVAHALHRVGLYYASGVMLVAVGVVLATVRQYDHLDTGLGVTLAFVGAWPWLAYLVTLAFPQETALPVLAGCYLASVGASRLATSWYGMFDGAPAAGTVGPEVVLAGLDDSVVVVDREEQIVRLNEAAVRTFGVDRGAVVGRRLEAVLGVDLRALRSADDFEVATAEGKRRFEVTVSALSDPKGRRRGDAVVLHDVTERRTREQRLAVLNRVLRHNLRNDMSAILGHADLVEDDALDGEEVAAGIREAADGLIDLGERAREVEEMMSIPRRLGAQTDVAAVVGDVVAEVRSEYPDVEVLSAVPTDLDAGVDRRLLRPVLYNVVENAARHNDADDPRVEVSASVSDEGPAPVAIAVTDNGPGIPEHERRVLFEGDETALQHGSGLGLWAVYWGITRMGGDLAFEDNEPRGTVVRIRLPAAAEGTAEAVEAAPVGEAG